MIDDRLVARIAELFYIQEVSQYEIARRFDFSTAKVCRLIKEAKKREIIEFKIKKFDKRFIELESEVEKKYGIKEVIIYYNSDTKDYDEDILFQKVGSLAAEYFRRIIKDDLNIALVWGKTLYHFVNNIKSEKKHNVKVFSTLGGANLIPPEYQNNNMVQMLSERVGGSAYLIYLPLVFENPIEELLKKESNIEEFLGSTSKIDYYFHGVGTVSEKARLYPHHGFDQGFLKSLWDKKIVGEVGFNFFDINGNFIKTELDDRSIKLNSDQIKKIKTKVAIVCGKDKINPLIGYLNTGFCDVLITDSETAFSVIDNKVI